MLNKYNSLLILGATASGKTKLAVHLANVFDGEIISADSRQVYKQLNIGAGKDYNEYYIENKHINHHLIDVASIEKTFYLKDFDSLSKSAFLEICSRNKLPIICGGTGLYLDALLKTFNRIYIEENHDLRARLQLLTNDDLLEKLKKFEDNDENNFDVNSRKRLIRAIEILDFKLKNKVAFLEKKSPVSPLIIGIRADVLKRRKNISERLNLRLKSGLIEEVENLLASGYTKEQLIFLGLEYKFITQYLIGEKTFIEMHQQLETAIHQFAKRQATWFRKMEREGFIIHWIDVDDNFNKMLDTAIKLVEQKL